MSCSPNDPRVVSAVDTAVRAMLGEAGHVGGNKYWDAIGRADFRGNAWCGAFQVWGFLQAGVNLMNAAWWLYVPYIKTFAERIGAWRDESGYGRQAIYEWHGDGVADHVGVSWPDPAAELFRAIEGNTSMGGSQDNGNGVLVKYRYEADILGWVDMHQVLAWMIDNGKWDGGGSYGTSTESGYTNIETLQRAVGATADNICGPNTQARVLAVASASEWGGTTGSSPRVRGKPPGLPPRAPQRGLIPARAGKTTFPATMSATVRAHPRACGENAGNSNVDPLTAGSSPRVRGKRARPRRDRRSPGLIPARAGKTACGSRPARP